MSETWRPIAASAGYEVSDAGRVRSPRGVILKPQSNGAYGYLSVQLTRTRREYVHRIVAAAFIGPIEGMDVDHRDGDTANNSASNLRIMTHAENMAAQRERKPRCRRGHTFDDAIWRGGRRSCRTCSRARWAASDERRRAARLTVSEAPS